MVYIFVDYYDIVSKKTNSIPNCFYLVFDFIDNDLAGIVRAVNKNLLPPS